MRSSFEPIAIVGQGCVLPATFSPEALWTAVAEGRDLTCSLPLGSGGVSGASARGGFVRGFREIFDPRGFALPVEEVLALDPLFAWTLHAGRAALVSAGLSEAGVKGRVGVVLGQLSLPSTGARRFAESIWLGEQEGPALEIEARNRFTSGLPAQFLARALGLKAGAFAVDAGGASSLYALKLACDRLRERRADVMLAGAVSAADRTFCREVLAALEVLSPTGRGRPFHGDADGLVPAEGAVFVTLKRLADARAADDRILAVVRGVAVGGDGRGRSAVERPEDAQERVIRQAYGQAGLEPSDISLVECDAAGVAVGDAAEVRILARVFDGCAEVPVGSLKSNLGHALGAGGLAGLLKVVAAFEAGIRPATLYADAPLPALAATPLRLVRRAEPWPSEPGRPRRAGLSAFGFGGHSAHAVLEEPPAPADAVAPVTVPVSLQPEIAVVSAATSAADGWDADEFVRVVFSGEARLDALGGQARTIFLLREDLRFAASELETSLPQQVLLLAVAHQAMAQVAPPPRQRTGIYVGIQADAEVVRYALRLAGREIPAPPFSAAAVAGALPSVAVQRLARQYDLAGPGYAVAAEELSGVVALELAVRALERGEIDVALVGAVDLSCEAVHAAAARTLLPADHGPPGDAACVLVLKRRAAARRAGERILALVDRVELAPADAGSAPADLVLGLGPPAGEKRFHLTPQLGHAHAASGLLHVAAAVLACHHRALPGRAGRAGVDTPAGGVPWLARGERRAVVSVETFSGQQGLVEVREERTGRPGPLVTENGFPRLYLYSESDREAVARRLAAGSPPDPGGQPGGPARLVLVAAGAEELDSRQAQARQLFEISSPGQALPAMEGICYRDRPLAGDLAFVMSGGAAAYPNMGRELLLALPELAVELGRRSRVLGILASWIYEGERTLHDLDPLEQLWGGSFLSLIHAELTRKVLGMEPRAVIGYSSGEVDALVAMEVWRELDELYHDSVESGLFSHLLGGSAMAVRRLWEGEWSEWVLHAAPAAVRAAVAAEERVYLTRIHSGDELAIGGESAACRRVIEALGVRAYRLGGAPLALHGPAVEQVAEAWLALHRRPAHELEGVRFYTHADGGYAYQPDSESAARALYAQASSTIDFPRLLERAWDDGVRLFVEHGPRELATGWTRKVLGPLGVSSEAYLAVSLDSEQGGLRHTADALARLLAAGVELRYGAWNDRPPGLVAEGLSLEGKAASREILGLAAHWPPVPPAASPRPPRPSSPAAGPPAAGPPAAGSPAAGDPVIREMTQLKNHLAQVQEEFIAGQAAVHRRFLELAERNLANLLERLPEGPAAPGDRETSE